MTPALSVGWGGVAMSRVNGWASVTLLVLLAAACGGRAIYHEVQPGETLYRIGRAYGVPHREIARANDLSDPSQLSVGQRLRIPGAAAQANVKPVRPRGGESSQRQARKRPWIRPKDAPRLQWPVPHGTVTSGFGPRRGSFHDGIDIAAPVGAAVRAAAKGDVAFSASLPGYGKVIILRHAAGYTTVYAHNDQNLVEEGQRVDRGQLIATVGRSGRTTGANLHFEVRKDNMAHDPLQFLPSRQRTMMNKQ